MCVLYTLNYVFHKHSIILLKPLIVTILVGVVHYSWSLDIGQMAWDHQRPVCA